MADIYDEEDRKSALIQGLLGAAFPLLGARRGSEFNAFGQAGLLGLNSYNRSLEGAAEARDRKAQREQQRLMWEQAQEERALKMQQMQQQREQQAAMQRAAGGAFTGGMPQMGPPTEQGEMQPGVAGQFNPQAYIAALQQQGLPQQAIAASKEYGPKEKEIHAQKVLTDPATQQRVVVNVYKDGTMDKTPFDPDSDPLHFIANGARAGIGVDPRSGAVKTAGVPTAPSADALLNDARQREFNAITRGNAAGGAADGLRKEFNALAPVQAWGKVQPALQAAREALPQDNASADLNLIYAAAKVFDPESVVRESETTMVAGAGSPAQRFVGQFNYVAGGGRLTPETRKQLMAQIEGRARGYESGYKSARTTYNALAQKRGVDPADVFIEPTATAGPPLEQPQDSRASGGKIAQAQASNTLPDPKQLPNGAVVTDTKTGRKLKVLNGRYVMP